MFKLSLIVGILTVGLWRTADVSAQCAKPSTVPDFEYLRFNGTWYAIQNIPNIFEAGLRCQQTTNFADVNVKGNFKVQDAGIKTSNEIVTSDSTLVTPNLSVPGLLENVGTGGLMRMPFYIMETDYVSYAYSYTCQSLFNIESAWILSRTRTLDPQVVQRGLDLFASLNVDIKKFEVTEQANCDLLDNRKH